MINPGVAALHPELLYSHGSAMHEMPQPPGRGDWDIDSTPV
jgi:hypothetical protein